MAGAPKGNQNATKAKQWTSAIERALEKRAKTNQTRAEVLDEMAEKFLKACDEGDLQSFKELGDRLEGKPAQAIVGADGGDFRMISRIENVIIDGNTKG
jgi:hypothetical protein